MTNLNEKHQSVLFTRVRFGEECSLDVLVQSVTGVAVGLLGELPFEVVEALHGLGHILELKEAASQPEVSLEVSGVQSQSL